MEDTINTYKIVIGKPKGRYHLKDLGLDGKIIFDCILKLHSALGNGTDPSCSGYGPVAGCCKNGNES
jgi:hypothetical protein